MPSDTLTAHDRAAVAPAARVDTAARGGEAALDLHKGIWDPGEPSGASNSRSADRSGHCPRWPEDLRLRNPDTLALIPGRCRATNLCDYCARLAAIENAEVLAIDAEQTGGPALWAV